jgi:hypothetical protein
VSAKDLGRGLARCRSCQAVFRFDDDPALDASERTRQLFCEELANRGRNGVSLSYSLVGILGDGSRKTVLSGLGSPEVPRSLEQEMERSLKIRDMAVPGERRR